MGFIITGTHDVSTRMDGGYTCALELQHPVVHAGSFLRLIDFVNVYASRHVPEVCPDAAQIYLENVCISSTEAMCESILATFSSAVKTCTLDCVGNIFEITSGAVLDLLVRPTTHMYSVVNGLFVLQV
jgi:hypothetical protein